MSDLDPVDEMVEVLRETLRANDLTLWSASGGHVFNSETALDGVARGLLARKVAEPSRTLDAAHPSGEVVRRAVVANFRARVVKAKGTQQALDYGQLLDWAWDEEVDNVRRNRAALDGQLKGTTSDT